MKRILVCCAAGLSTSMVVNRMRQAAEQQNIAVELNAAGINVFTESFSRYDCCLLGPQVKTHLEACRAQAATSQIPISVINSMDYGMMRGDKILADALALLA